MGTLYKDMYEDNFFSLIVCDPGKLQTIVNASKG